MTDPNDSRGQPGIHDASMAYQGYVGASDDDVNSRNGPEGLATSPHHPHRHGGQPYLSRAIGEAASPVPMDSAGSPAYGQGRPNLNDERAYSSTDTAGKKPKTLASRASRRTGNSSLSALRSREVWFPTGWSGAFMLTVLVEAVVVISLVGTVFGLIQTLTESSSRVQDLKTVAVFFSLTIFGMIFLVLIAIDANRLKNTIQIIGVTIFNVAILITAALEISQVRKALRLQDESGAGVECLDRPGEICNGIRSLYPPVEKLLIATTIIVGAAQFPLTFIAFKLWSEWGWRIYKIIGADIKLRRYYLYYQVLVVLLKFDFFFGSGFTMSYLILVVDQSDWEYGVTIAAVPLAVLVLFLCAFSVRRENIVLMLLSILCFLAGGVYFVYKITRIYDPSTAELYRTIRLTLTFFSIFAILSLLLTLANAITCLANFGKGLREAHASVGHLAQHRPNPSDRSSIDGGDPTRAGPEKCTVIGAPDRVGEGKLDTVRFGPSSGSRLSLD